jgi:hypothetical protein
VAIKISITELTYYLVQTRQLSPEKYTASANNAVWKCPQSSTAKKAGHIWILKKECPLLFSM